MATEVTMKIVQLEKIHDLEWPTDPALVASFRKTLQQGGHFSPIRLNRPRQPAANWSYEILDGFHRFAASKAEHLEALLCQIEDHEERAARYERIRACIGKPAEVTIQRAQRELKGAFIDDMLAQVGHPNPLYEPILGEDGLVHARRHLALLPTDPLQALEALTDHLIVTTITAHAHPSLEALAARPFGPRSGWEKLVTTWLEEMGQRWGYNTFWLVDLLHVEVLLEAEPGSRIVRRYAQLLWQIPDVDVRRWFRRQLQLQPRVEIVERVIEQMGFYYQVTGGGIREGDRVRKKSEVLSLLNHYPSLTELAAHLEMQQLREPQERSAAPRRPDEDFPAVAHGPNASAAPVPEVFAFASPGFVKGASPITSLPPPQHAGPVEEEAVFRPIHEACAALLSAAHTLTTQYGRAWLHWKCAQADLAALRDLLQSGE
jgi:hypothetical protein